MIRLARVIAYLSAIALAGATMARAQAVSGFDTSRSWSLERLGKDHVRLVGQVEIEGGDMKFYAEEIDVFSDVERLVASGNVVFTQGGNRIAADRVEFNYRDRTGIFYKATGIASLGARADRSMFGTQEPDVFFYGETLEKIGPQKYKITKGGFTTCVQPTPRWELTSGTVTLNLDHYALLMNSLFKVKGVPVLYLPVFYYPIQEDDRATGFLIPAYGASTIKGQTLSNAFFWAINRSHDASFFHDWFSKTGQGGGAEYRYVLGEGSEGTLRTYFLNEHESVYTTSGGAATTIPARRSYEVRGGANQALPGGLRARGRADYFSDVTVQQTYHANIYEASRRQRTYAGSVSGMWGPYTLNGAFDRSEFFFGTTSSTLTGGTPRVSASRADRPMLGSSLYVTVGGEYARILRESRSGGRVVDNGLSRVDFTPLVRFPFTRWQFFTVNSSFAWRNTYWTESRDQRTGAQIEQPISRRYFDFQSQMVGPVLNRIWNTPGNRYAEKFKHTIEPFLNLQRISASDEFDRIVQLDAVDSVVGGTTRVGYGLNTRLYAKRKDGASGAAREIATVAVQQTYYTDANAARFDRLYRTSFSGTPPSHFSPVSILGRASPSDQTTGTLRAEYDTQFHALRTIGADGMFAWKDRLHTTAGWTQRRFIKELSGFNDRNRLDHYLNSTTTMRFRGNRFGGAYSFNYDLLRDLLLQQRLMGYYNAQCCGFAVEYQTFDFSGLGSRAPVPQDRRFNFSFTLAGIGTFANFFGALGGATR